MPWMIEKAQKLASHLNIQLSGQTPQNSNPSLQGKPEKEYRP